MPENIFKIYPPRSIVDTEIKPLKKGSGLWSNDKEEDRLAHVNKALKLYFDKDDFFDYLDLVWFLKNAVIGDIYLSEKVFARWNNGNGIYWNGCNEKIRDIIERIIKRKTKLDGKFDESLMQIRKWLGKQYSGNILDPLVFEHVVPAKVYINYLINWYDEHGPLTLGDLRAVREKVSVCIVTKEEDAKLNNAGCREDMPEGVDFMKEPFARYEQRSEKTGEILIKIHGR